MGLFRRPPHPDCKAVVGEPVHDGEGLVVPYPGCSRIPCYAFTAYGEEVGAVEAKAHAQSRVEEHKTRGIRGW